MSLHAGWGPALGYRTLKRRKYSFDLAFYLPPDSFISGEHSVSLRWFLCVANDFLPACTFLAIKIPKKGLKRFRMGLLDIKVLKYYLLIKKHRSSGLSMATLSFSLASTIVYLERYQKWSSGKKYADDHSYILKFQCNGASQLCTIVFRNGGSSKITGSIAFLYLFSVYPETPANRLHMLLVRWMKRRSRYITVLHRLGIRLRLLKRSGTAQRCYSSRCAPYV